MRLRELGASFVACVTGGNFRHVEDWGDAQGVLFLCPLCFQRNGGVEGTHSVLVWFSERGVPGDRVPQPRWRAGGSSLDDLSLEPSVHVQSGCGWHGWVRSGSAA